MDEGSSEERWDIGNLPANLISVDAVSNNREHWLMRTAVASTRVLLEE